MTVEAIPNKELDRWIENLSNCKQLEEIEVKRLTDKVSLQSAYCSVCGRGACNGVAPFFCRVYNSLFRFHHRQGRYSRRSLMCRKLGAR